VPGIGVSRVRSLHTKFGVDSLEKLIAVAEDGRLTALSGIGARSAEKILTAARALMVERGPEEVGLDAGVQGRILDEMRGLTSEADAHVAQALREAASAAVSESVAFWSVLRCQACHRPGMSDGGDVAECGGCGKRYEVRDGVVDFLLVHDRPSLAQRLMEFEPYADVYESIARPLAMRLVTDRGIEEEVELSADLLTLGLRGGLSAPMVLDVGCGPGNFTRRFADRVLRDGGYVVGLDVSWPMLRKAVEESGRRREDNLRFVRGDAARLPFGDDSFDAVHTAGALHLMRGVDGVLQELARVVKPGGLVVIGTFVLGSNPLKRVVKRVTGRGVGFRWFDRDDLTQRLRRVGLDATEQALDGAALTLKAVRV
jgi:SAM-dependent methyltransferase